MIGKTQLVSERVNESGLRTLHLKCKEGVPELDVWCRIKKIEPAELLSWNSWQRDGFYHLYIAWRKKEKEG
jgi:hypothetical protein